VTIVTCVGMVVSAPSATLIVTLISPVPAAAPITPSTGSMAGQFAYLSATARILELMHLVRSHSLPLTLTFDVFVKLAPPYVEAARFVVLLIQDDHREIEHGCHRRPLGPRPVGAMGNWQADYNTVADRRANENCRGISRARARPLSWP